MQKGHLLQFTCQNCGHPVKFSVFQDNIEKLQCSDCGKTYAITDESLNRQLKLFESLCLQIQKSEEILADTSIGIDIDGKTVKIPFKLLLTRFTSILDLKIGDKKVPIHFRIEPVKETKDTK